MFLQPENPYTRGLENQQQIIIPAFTLESGVVLNTVPIAYSTWGKLSPAKTNCIVLCHTLTSSSDVTPWWGALFQGTSKAFDMTRFFIICLNCLGSPYGSASPRTQHPEKAPGEVYGPSFPLTSIRDDVRIHKMVLDMLGVKQVASVIGASMGGMHALEWAFLGSAYVRTVVPIATSSRQSGWCAAWFAAQRQMIENDAKYRDGYYSLDNPPVLGLGAARKVAYLTYKSKFALDERFGVTGEMDNRYHPKIHRPDLIHNQNGAQISQDPLPERTQQPISELMSYLQYQAEKFATRFDANCYIAMTRKFDTHDITRARSCCHSVPAALSMIQQPTLIICAESDGLYSFSEHQEMAANIPNSQLEVINTQEGHDFFVIDLEQVARHIRDFLDKHITHSTAL